ncbi:MAG: hydantoinase/oxoprolinase N-terminal domain-containing protein, partial [Armatimonadota bacterium]
MRLGLGIDAGGTYTDSVLVDFATGEVVDKAKALTTHHHLIDGITESVGRLDRGFLSAVGLVALSTTLATNSIVEGHGAPAGLILLGYDEYMTTSLGLSPFVCVRGRHDITGEELEPLDASAVAQATLSLLNEHHVQAIAISGMCSVMNPSHELAAAEVVRQIAPAGIPIVCGHELTLELDAIRRATTAFLNARLVPVVQALMSATEKALSELGISAPLMVVRGDGSLMTRETAAKRPVETILSGPAASIVGARALTGLQDA